MRGASMQNGRKNGGNLAARTNALSDRRQQIIRPVLANPREFVLLSVRDLAKALGTDAATVVRIVRGMGFENYRAFQRHLHEASIAYATSLDTMRAAMTGNNGNAQRTRDSLEQDAKNLSALKHSLDPQQIAAVAARMHSARRILILGGDAATALVVFLEYSLTLLGMPVFAGTGHGRISHLTRSTNPKDVVLAISFRRGLRMTVEGLQKAHEKGAFAACAVGRRMLSCAGRDAVFRSFLCRPDGGVKRGGDGMRQRRAIEDAQAVERSGRRAALRIAMVCR